MRIQRIVLEQEHDVPTPEEEQIIWPKGHQIKKQLPKFGSNRNPATILGRKKYDNH